MGGYNKHNLIIQNLTLMSFTKNTQEILKQWGYFADSQTIRNIRARGHKTPQEAAEVAILNQEGILLNEIKGKLKRLELLMKELKAM